jgi:hypothetical protein
VCRLRLIIQCRLIRLIIQWNCCLACLSDTVSLLIIDDTFSRTIIQSCQKWPPGYWLTCQLHHNQVILVLLVLAWMYCNSYHKGLMGAFIPCSAWLYCWSISLSSRLTVAYAVLIWHSCCRCFGLYQRQTGFEGRQAGISDSLSMVHTTVHCLQCSIKQQQQQHDRQTNNNQQHQYWRSRSEVTRLQLANTLPTMNRKTGLSGTQATTRRRCYLRKIARHTQSAPPAHTVS